MAFFKSVFESGFQFAGFQFLIFCSTNFLSSAKFRVGFVESLKSASRFLVCVFGQHRF